MNEWDSIMSATNAYIERLAAETPGVNEHNALQRYAFGTGVMHAIIVDLAQNDRAYFDKKYGEKVAS